MEKQTIAQVRAQDPESLWHFLNALPGTMEAQIFYALMLAGSLGMMGSYIMKWSQGQIEGNLFKYLFSSNLRNTSLSFFTYTGACMTAIYAGAFHVTDAAVFVGWGHVVWLGALNGFGIDAIVNKGQRAIWTQEQRQTRTP